MDEKMILVVEDESITAEDIVQRLEKMGYAVTGISSTGEEAVALADASPPDLVLMDVKIKGAIDGIETANIIRGKHDVPVVYLTAYSDAITRSKIETSEPYGLMMKPFQDSELQGVIETALYRHDMEK
ncbi:response regulator [bacterium]|nr:response regulator [bacterium]